MPYCRVNGIAAHYRETGEAGKGDTVVLLHAGGTSSTHWRKVVPHFEDRFHLVAPDLIGFGETASWEGSRELTHDDQADLVEHMIGRAAAGPVHVVGHSYGGAVAMRLALRHRALVKSLVLIEPVLTPLLQQAGKARLFEAERRLAAAFIADAEAARSVSAWRHFIDHYNGDGTWDALSGNTRYRFLSMTHETADAYRSNLNNPTTLQDLQAVAMPTLLLFGARTTETYRRICRILGDHLPNRTSVELDGAGHMSPLTHPDEVARAIVRHVGLPGATRPIRGAERRNAA
jgi:pimeloyl-ACP methyl ester carboxylesterase